MSEGEEMLEAGSVEKSNELRAKLQAAIDKTKVAYQQVEDKTVAAAKATDKTIREYPYYAIGIGFGLGLLIGVLAARSARD